MRRPRIDSTGTLVVDLEPVEEHDHDIYSAVPRLLDTGSKPIEIRPIKLGQIELGHAVQGCPRTGSLIRNGKIPFFVFSRKCRLRCPESNQIVIMGVKKAEVSLVIKSRLAITRVIRAG